MNIDLTHCVKLPQVLLITLFNLLFLLLSGINKIFLTLFSCLLFIFSLSCQVLFFCPFPLYLHLPVQISSLHLLMNLFLSAASCFLFCKKNLGEKKESLLFISYQVKEQMRPEHHQRLPQWHAHYDRHISSVMSLCCNGNRLNPETPSTITSSNQRKHQILQHAFTRCFFLFYLETLNNQ